MKKLLLVACASLLLSFNMQAQKSKAASDKEEDIYKFTVVKELPCTPVKNQNRSSTCWSFSSVGFIESELLRLGKGEYHLSEMFVVRNNFEEKADKYVRMHGSIAFSPGGLTENVFQLIERHGIVPESVYSGLNYGDTMHIHNELDNVTGAYMAAVLKSKKLTTAWKDGLNGILDAYLGEKPEKFVYNGIQYTPQSFAQSLGLNMNDYVNITSFTHHPFYAQFVLEIPDNYFWGISYNVPLDEMMEIIDSSIEMGYTVSWASDVSEEGFQYRNGYAIVADKSAGEDLSGSDRARWEGNKGQTTKKGKEAKPAIAKELAITQELRQQAFDNYETQDDHGMLIMGTAKDQEGNRYYKVKNSWGTDRSRYDGYFFASVPFVQYKTTGVMVHKSVIPDHIADKLGIKK